MEVPLSNLDAKPWVQTRAEIVMFHQRIGTTTVSVTHDQAGDGGPAPALLHGVQATGTGAGLLLEHV